MPEQSEFVARHLARIAADAMTVGADLGAEFACGLSLAELILPTGFHHYPGRSVVGDRPSASSQASTTSSTATGLRR
jgi:hypothetical protein